MAKQDIKLLDCTLRDGGYINDWDWGFSKARDIVRTLTKAGIDMIEVGFLRDVPEYSADKTVCRRIEELNRLLPAANGRTMYSAMAMRSNYSIDNLADYCGEGIELIRVTAHDYDIEEGLDFAAGIKEKGYKVSVNPINIMGYTDEQLLRILDKVNTILPYQFSIVDTFGSMKRKDLDRIVSLVDHNLDRGIRVALHLHENMSQGIYLSQNYVDRHLNRPIAVDGSLMGMGRTPGNLPLELIADYLNESTDTNYEIDYLMDLIQDYIEPIKGETRWGYTPAYFLSARFNLHRNYAEHYLNKGDLTNRDINHILSRIDRKKATVFDPAYADQLYEEYKNNAIDDSPVRSELHRLLSGRQILVIAPGSSVSEYRDRISSFISEEAPVVISVNFLPDQLPVDFAFFSNNKRFDRLERCESKIIATSNLNDDRIDFRLDYNSLSGAFSQGCNSLIMLLKLLKEMDVKEVHLAGADGYQIGGRNYYNGDLRSATEHGTDFNHAVAEAIHRIGIEPVFLTPSAYEDKRG